MTLPAQVDAAFDVVEMEADLNVYLDRPGFRAEKAAVTITSGVGHLPVNKGDKFTLWFGRGIDRQSFRGFRAAAEKAIEIIGTANTPVTPRFDGRKAKAFTRILEAKRLV